MNWHVIRFRTGNENTLATRQYVLTRNCTTILNKTTALLRTLKRQGGDQSVGDLFGGLGDRLSIAPASSGTCISTTERPSAV